MAGLEHRKRSGHIQPRTSIECGNAGLSPLVVIPKVRRCELFALKWADIDFDRQQINVQRSIYLNVVGNCKTEVSRKPVPMDPALATELRTWKRAACYTQPDDWVFASLRTRGTRPCWPDTAMSRVIRPTATRVGIEKHIGWHTFRRSYSTLLVSSGENVKVVQELMQHANCRSTLEIYSQARDEAKRAAQHRVIEMICPVYVRASRKKAMGWHGA